MTWPPSITSVSTAILAIAIFAMFKARATLKGSTLAGPWAWLQIALIALLVTQLTFADGRPAIRAAVEFLAAVATVCPIVSVLGAKRPQQRAWHFVVLSLWIVLVLPAAEVLLIRSGAQLRMHAIRSGFLTTLILLGLANYALTRFSLAACAFALGQWLLLGPTIIQRPFARAEFALGSGLLGLAVITVCLKLPPRRTPGKGWNRAWLDFRDAFGALWALRVMERMNAATRRLGWKNQLTWRGFRAGDDPQRAAAIAQELALDPSAERSFRMLLRRFVDSDWYPPNAPDSTRYD